ncbi:MAG TPA: ABC transporter ATP-binding protein [Acidimicrobiales bacterium]|nr:ABC transporter ATP-binding protein [Acidimicrobiales bacterium]
MIQLTGLRVEFAPVVALGGVDLEVAAGEWVSLIGANGAGKTTLLRSLAHLEAHQGSVSIDGSALAELSRRRRARLVAYVPQQPDLPPDMSVIDYTLLGRTPHIGYFGVETREDLRHCIDLLERLGLVRMADRHLATLSGGELQRVVLARALAQDAPVLLLDEPTSALDLGRRVDALELVDEVRHERGLTILSAMHDLTLAAQFADRLVLLSEGRVASAGPAAEVLEEASLTRHFGGRVQVLITDDGELVVVPRRARPTRRMQCQMA